MKTQWNIVTRCATKLVAAGMLLGLAAPAAFAQNREHTAEFGLQIADYGGGTVTGQHGASLDFSDDTAWGVTGGYNISDRLYVGGEWTWANPSYKLTRPLDPGNVINSVSAEADVSSLLFKVAFNFLQGPLTPYVEAGAGWVQLDSNVANGPPTTGCWWDPWWGYICSSFYDTYSDTRTGYTYAAGFRWDMSDEIVLRASYGEIEIDSARALEDIKFDALRVELAWKF